ncbi:uncharacterized protein LOC101737591 isoform X2 [Bombyx mori]|uniref:Uncharacterized protein n=1 Tax=Bombyx mori TaxID=7091 RepID=A0A8R2LTJ1_BOMMO|nr:uncharacterized protein LOC101737591 isoform X2 [Bombyx mori]
MSNNNSRIESLLFDYKTSSLRDYNNGQILPITATKYIDKEVCLRIPPAPLKYIHTLSHWKPDGRVSVDLFVRPKDVVRTNPRDVQQRYERPKDIEHKNILKSRPRLVMTPAVCMDDIQLEKREKFIEDFYSTTKNVTMSVPPSNNIKASFPGTPAPANPVKENVYELCTHLRNITIQLSFECDEIHNKYNTTRITLITIPNIRAPYVSPEWRMESVSWDGRQLRAFAEPNKEFWLAKTPQCQVCDETAARLANKKTRNHGN